jgi:hypothetical protein
VKLDMIGDVRVIPERGGTQHGSREILQRTGDLPLGGPLAPAVGAGHVVAAVARVA